MSEGIARPSLARTHTRQSEGKRKEGLDEGMRVTVDGDVFEVRLGDVTPALAAEVRKNTGMSFMKLMQTLSDDPDIDLLTVFEWLARRVRGEDVELWQVEFTYGDAAEDGFDITAAGPSSPIQMIDGKEVVDPQT